MGASSRQRVVGRAGEDAAVGAEEEQEIQPGLPAPLDRLAGKPVCVVGSSLGGFYATWAAETFGCRAVLLNPAVRPYEFVKDYTGPQRNYVTGEVQIVDASLADDLRAMERRPSRPSDYWLLVQTGDETLNYREAVRFYTGCRQTVIEGGEHGFSGYAEKLPQIWDFAQRR